MKGFVGILILTLCISFGCEGDKKKESIKSEKITLFTDLEGQPVSLEQFKGKRVLVNYWATWCVPCLKEFPTLIKAKDSLENENYVFLFPSPDSQEKIKAFNEARKYPLQFLSLNEPLENLNIYALPATMLYATDGSEYKRIDGVMEWSSPEVIKLLRSVP